MSFWRWLAVGSGGKSGLKRLLDPWMIFHVGVGVILAVVIPAALEAAANVFLFPLAAVLVGLSFAWGGNAQALLQTREIEDFARHNPGGIEEYVRTFQLAVLVLIGTLVLWGLVATGLADTYIGTERAIPYFIAESFLYMLASLSIRECWHVVMGASRLLEIRAEIRKELRRRGLSD